MPRQAADLLIEALRRGVSVLIAGGTGSGKTTLTAALLTRSARRSAWSDRGGA